MQQIVRFNHTISTTVRFTTSTSTTGGFGFNTFAGAMIICPSAATLTFYVKASETASPVQVYDSSGSAVTATVPAGGGAIPVPDELFAATYVMVVSSAQVDCTILLKA